MKQVMYGIRISEGRYVPHADEVKAGVLTVSAEYKDAVLGFTVGTLRQMLKNGIRTVVFQTADQETSFEIASIIEGRLDYELVKLFHDGKKARLTVGKDDLSGLLK